MASDARRDNRNRPPDAARMRNAPPTHKHKAWRWIVVLALLAALVGLLPNIVAHSPLLPWGVKLATANVKGTVTVQSASLGWFSHRRARR